MMLFVVFGLMNIVAMAVLASVVLVEKVWEHGPAFANVVGGVCLLLALTVVIAPSITPGLYQPGPMHM